MEQALAPAVPLAVAPGALDRVMAMPAATKMKLGAGVAGLAAVIVAICLWSSQGDYRVLFANLPDKEGGAVVAQLSTMQVPYKFAEGGTAILVPADKVNEVRLKLASAGLPKSSVVGFELMDNAKFGQTQTQERVNLQRALEGELTRTISSIDAVESARVHLALPNQNGFFREQQKPSASVVLMLRGGRTLDRSQLAGIVHLVASSVPELQTRDVSVLDQTGALLTENGDRANSQGLDATQLQYRTQMEASYTKRIQELLEPVIGRENLRASVTADIDFSQSEATSEQFKPNGNPADATVRSQQSSDAGGSAGNVPSGVPGASSNQPPVPATAPINGASAPLQAAQGGTVGANGHRETVTNYEVDRTVRVTRNATGLVRHLNAAVVVNQKVNTDAKGKTTSTPLSQDEMDKLTALVQEAIGYDQTRGDSVKVINAPFKAEAALKAEELPLWKQQWLLDLLRAGGVPAGLTLVALAVLFGLVRPAVMAALAPPVVEPRDEGLNAVVDDANELPMDALPELLEAPHMAKKLESARQLAKDNPTVVANIVRDWVNGESAA
ncbi:MAG: flagellar M-ring protein FliF [Burkholderiales bacterium]|jgi:flagellar M-ring protein FliF|nr:flagellar M-ring protein FliF [Burkholderiales bacterium]